MKYVFITNERLGIPLPELYVDWEQLEESEQAELLLQWEHIRGTIPDQIIRLEKIIIEKQYLLDKEEDFPTACR